MGLGTFVEAEDIKPLKVLSFADATASGLGRGGADSSAWPCVLTRVVDFTWMGAESGCFVPGSEFPAMFAAMFAEIFGAVFAPMLVEIRITEELPTPAEGLSSNVAVAVFGAKLWVAELARSSVLVEGAVTGEDVGAGAGAGCPESWGVLTGCVLDLLSCP